MFMLTRVKKKKINLVSEEIIKTNLNFYFEFFF